MSYAITVDDVSKRYRLGTSSGRGGATFRESFNATVAAPLKWARSRLSRGRRAAAAPHAGDMWALKDVSFKAKRGESIGIIGRNGAGKSTLLKVLSRITAPTTGGVDICGRVGSLLEVGTGFHPELTGRENVYLNGAIIGMSRREIASKFDEIVEFSEIEKFIDTPVKRYSSGMYTRLAFSVTAHLHPEILLIDEVLSVGDLAFQRKCMDHAKRMLSKNVTLLFVSHNMFTIKAMCDRAIYLENGRLTKDAATEEVVELYDQDSRLDMMPWAKDMIGSDPALYPILVTGIDMLGEDGEPKLIFDHGERMRLRVRFDAREPVDQPNINIAFIRSDNVACCCYNTSMDRFPTGVVSGAGALEVVTPPLKLVADLYTIHVLIWDQKFQRLYSAQIGKNFHVRDDVLSTEFGVFHEAAQWSWADPKRELKIA